MASLRQRGAALVAGGFWWILLAHRRRSLRASRRERERERFQNPGGNTFTAWISLRWQSHLLLMNGRVVGEAESAPAPPPPELYLEPIFHRTAGRHTAIRGGTNPTV